MIGDENPFIGVHLVAVFDRVDDRLAHGDADPVHRVPIQAGQLAHAVADHLHEIQHLEVAVNLESDGTATCQHAGRWKPALTGPVTGRKL